MVRRIPSSWPLISLGLAGLAALTYLVPGWTETLQYDRAAVAAGEVWRLATGHWTHWDLDQLFWNVGALIALGAAGERLGRRRFVICVAVSAVAILVAVQLLAPAVPTYRGLSGIDSALFVYLAVGLVRREREKGLGATLATVALFAFAAKVAYEMASGATVFVDPSAGIVVLPLAHAVGGTVGLGVAACARMGFDSSAQSADRSSTWPARETTTGSPTT